MELPMPDGPDKEMWLALIQQDLGRLADALRAGANANLPDEQGMAPVMLASMLYNLEAVKLLGAHGAKYPKDSYGWHFEVYFEVVEPWFEWHEMWSAERVAVHRRDVELLDALLTLPGALEVLTSDGSVGNSKESPCYAHKLLDQKQDPSLIALIVHHAAAKTLSADHTMSGAESRLLGFVTERFIVPLLRQCNDPYLIKVRSTAEHVRDCGYAVAGNEHVIRALSFGIEGSGAQPPLSSNAVEVVTGIISAGYEDASLDVVILQLSHNVWIRMAACTYVNPDTYYDRKDRPKPNSIPIEGDDYYSVAGTIFFSTEQRALERHMRLLGPARLGLDLAVAVYADNYELTKAAIDAGADTAMTCIGEMSADVLAAYYGRAKALQAVLENDPIARLRLQREKFDLDSPLRMAIRGASWNIPRIGQSHQIFPLECRSPTEGYRSFTRNLEAITTLISAGANVNSRDLVSTPLEAACTLKPTEIVTALLEAGADPEDIVEGRSVVSDKIGDATAILLHSWWATKAMQRIARQ